jgi:NAD(P)-dependent dehydrogenase (short-subunit alcohol dehydrogenase family)
VTRAAPAHPGEGSAIVNCGSITEMQGSKELLDDAATKGAIHAFTRSPARNLVGRKIRVNCVAPGTIWMVLQPASRPAERVAAHGRDAPMGRPGQPEEVAPAFVVFASGADSGDITGEVLTLLGGETTAS